MDYTYNAEGVIQTYGCPELEFTNIVVVAWPVGSTAYDRISATRGRMEAVVIKRVKIHKTRKSYGQYRIVYTDTLNSLYTDYDLISHDDAKTIVIAYLNRKIASIDAELLRRNC